MKIGKKSPCYVCSTLNIAVGFLLFAAAEPIARYLIGEANSISVSSIFIAVLFFLAYFMAEKKKMYNY